MRSLRQILADSHVAAVTIGLLLLWALDAAFRGAWEPVSRILSFLLTAVLILDIPAFSLGASNADRVMLTNSAIYLYWAIVDFAAAWLLARWVYRKGPVLGLSECYHGLIGRKDA